MQGDRLGGLGWALAPQVGSEAAPQKPSNFVDLNNNSEHFETRLVRKYNEFTVREKNLPYISLPDLKITNPSSYTVMTKYEKNEQNHKKIIKVFPSVLTYYRYPDDFILFFY